MKEEDKEITIINDVIIDNAKEGVTINFNGEFDNKTGEHFGFIIKNLFGLKESRESGMGLEIKAQDIRVNQWLKHPEFKKFHSFMGKNSPNWSIGRGFNIYEIDMSKSKLSWIIEDGFTGARLTIYYK